MPDSQQQIIEILARLNRVLIIVPARPTTDHVAAALGLQAYLQKLDKQVEVLAPGAKLDPRLSFLSGFANIVTELEVNRGLVIEVSTKNAAVNELAYKKQPTVLEITVLPKSGQFAKDDVAVRAGAYPYGAVVVLGASTLDHLGDFYSRNTGLFFETPVVNIDTHGSNENFGQFNQIAINNTSVCETVYDLLVRVDRQLIDRDVATALLTGIIAETNSFQHLRTTPQSFVKASELIGLGAQQQEIIGQIYKNKSLGFLKLWGRVLARLKAEPNYLLAHSSVNAVDLEKTQATADEAIMVIRQMPTELSFAKVFLFFNEVGPGQTLVYCSAPASLGADGLFAEFHPTALAGQILQFTVPLPLAQAEARILEIIRPQAAKLVA